MDLCNPVVELAVAHRWDLTLDAAAQLQCELAPQVVISPLADVAVRTIGGVDVAYNRSDDTARAAVVAMSYPGMALVSQAVAEVPVSFPYIPGFLSFREIPVILAAFGKIKNFPDLLVVDGHGIAHQRRFGLASHLGVILDLPTIGCAKSILVGQVESLGKTRGSLTHLIDGEDVIGAALRTRDEVKPVFVSVGHRVDLDSAARVLLNCCRGYRLPEPIRWAHRLASNEGPQSLAGSSLGLA